MSDWVTRKPKCTKIKNGRSQHEWGRVQNGNAENPGCWSHGDKIIVYTECKHCKLECRTICGFNSSHESVGYRPNRR